MEKLKSFSNENKIARAMQTTKKLFYIHVYGLVVFNACSSNWNGGNTGIMDEMYSEMMAYKIRYSFGIRNNYANHNDDFRNKSRFSLASMTSSEWINVGILFRLARIVGRLRVVCHCQCSTKNKFVECTLFGCRDGGSRNSSNGI